MFLLAQLPTVHRPPATTLRRLPARGGPSLTWFGCHTYGTGPLQISRIVRRNLNGPARFGKTDEVFARAIERTADPDTLGDHLGHPDSRRPESAG